MIKAVLINLFVFLTYISIGTLFLLNKSGGADIIFHMFTGFCIFIHLIINVVQVFKSSNKQQSILVLISFIIVVLVFLANLDKYMLAVWNLV
jgi:hypothetical protein